MFAYIAAYGDIDVAVIVVNVGVDVVAISWGVDSVIAPDVFAILIWFIVPVRLVATGSLPVDPIISCPFVS